MAFLEITRHQNFAKAAHSVHLSPSGVSMLVKELERQVGAQLFERTTRSVALTEAGLRLVPVAERILEELHGLGEAVRGTEEALRSRLDIAATPIVAASLLPQVLGEFSRDHPGVRMRLADLPVGAVHDAVIQGEADLGLGFFVKAATSLLREPLCRFRLVCISPPGVGSASQRGRRTWRSLADVNLLSLPADNPIQAVIESHLPRRLARTGERMTMNFLGSLIAMVEAGMGHAVVPSIVMAECLRHGLTVELLEEPAVHLELFVVTRRGAAVKAQAQTFESVLRAAAQRLEKAGTWAPA